MIYEDISPDGVQLYLTDNEILGIADCLHNLWVEGKYPFTTYENLRAKNVNGVILPMVERMLLVYDTFHKLHTLHYKEINDCIPHNFFLKRLSPHDTCKEGDYYSGRAVITLNLNNNRIRCNGLGYFYLFRSVEGGFCLNNNGGLTTAYCIEDYAQAVPLKWETVDMAISQWGRSFLEKYNTAKLKVLPAILDRGVMV